MIALCSICKALIDGGNAPILDENRAALEWRALGERLDRHFRLNHPDQLAQLVPLLAMFAHYLLSFAVISSDPDFAIQQQQAKETLTLLLHSVRLEFHSAGGLPSENTCDSTTKKPSSNLLQ